MISVEQPVSYQRNHSFSKRVSIAQIMAMLIFTIEALIFYIYIFQWYQHESLKISMVIIFSCSLFGLIMCSIITGQIDPTDELIIASKNNNKDKVNNENIKSVKYCSICRDTVKVDSRHCSTCQKEKFSETRCCEEFDHHCIWLNTCIGGKNYKLFFVTIIFAFFNLLAYLISLSFLTGEFIATNMEFKSFGFVIAWIFAFIIAVFCILIFNLIIFHIYLNCIGLSTYDFIVIRAVEKPKAKEVQPVQEYTKRKLLPPIKNNEKKGSLENDKEEKSKYEPSSENIILHEDKDLAFKMNHEKDVRQNENEQIRKVKYPNIFISDQVNRNKETFEEVENKHLSEKNEGDRGYLDILNKLKEKENELFRFFTKNPSLNLFIGEKQCQQSVDEIVTIFMSGKIKEEQKGSFLKEVNNESNLVEKV